MKVKAVHHGSERSECNPIVADGRECPYQNDRRMALANIKSRRGFRLPSRRFNLSAKRYAMSSPEMTCLAKKPAQTGQKSRTPSQCALSLPVTPYYGATQAISIACT